MKLVPMTELDISAAIALDSCTFLPGSYNKRFARNIAAAARSDTPELTLRQLKNLWFLVYRHRLQISKKSGLVEVAKEREAMFAKQLAEQEDEEEGVLTLVCKRPLSPSTRRDKEIERLKEKGQIDNNGRLVF